MKTQSGGRAEKQQDRPSDIDFYRGLTETALAPLWQRLHYLVPKSPTTAAIPYLWDYDGIVRNQIMTSGQIVTAEEAERRVLILENPGLPDQASITPSLYAGLQLVLPGEIAPQHRHSQSALRFAVEGNGAYTAINGERVLMHPGDFIITPSWRWHDHGNLSDRPMVWLDGLDIPMLAFFGAGFAESGDAPLQAELRAPGYSAAKFGNNLLPVDWQPEDRSSPILHYPYERSRASLDLMSRTEDPDPCHGYKLRYINPANGQSPMPTIGGFIQHLPGGFSTAPYRSTDGTVFHVIEGEGESVVGTTRLKWKARDIFVLPSWHTVTHHCSSDATLFSFSDRPAQQALAMWREDRHPGVAG